MKDDQYLNDSSSFSLFSKKEIEQQKYIDEISIIAEKYNILENDNQLIGSTDKTFLYLINYILNLHNKKETIPKDLENLFLENIFLKEQLNSYLEKILSNLTKNDSIHFFNEIRIILFILTIGTKGRILNTYSNYNYASISELFRFYESLLQKLFKENLELFSLTFDSYILLLKAFIQLCNINSIDVIRAKTIKILIEFMTETINIVKYTTLLDEKKIKKVNSIQGKYLYYFSHLDEIIFDINDLDHGIEKYLFCLEKQKDGYMLAEENNFGEEKNSPDSEEFFIFKNYSSILILELISKIKNILKEELYFKTENFQKILRFYYKNFSMDFNNKIIPKNIKTFEEDLLNSFIHNYNINLKFTKIMNYHLIIENFISSEKEFDSKNLETVYRILLFAPDIEDFKYHIIAQLLVDSVPVKNDYHEFYKLSIFNLIINKSFVEKYTIQKEEILNKIIDYINNNNIDYHLLSIYSRLYLSLSLFYSTNQDNLEKAQKLYAIFIQISDRVTFENEYLGMNNKIMKNLKNFNPDITQEYIVNEFLIAKKLELEKEVSNITNKINSKNKPNYDDIKNTISKLISNNIFHGLCEVYIFDSQTEPENLHTSQFENYVISTDKNCKIQFFFSTVYEINFYSIINDYKEFIEINICKILDNYKQKDTNYYYSDDDDEYEINY